MKTHFKKPLFALALLAGLGLLLTGRVTAQTFTTVYSFTSSDGTSPSGTLILSGNTLYGTTRNGIGHRRGTVFAVNADGTGFTNLYSFTIPSGPSPGHNSDGANPYAGLILSGTTLYGTAYGGGTDGFGTVFGVNTDGTDFTNLHSFTALSGLSPGTNSDGAQPQARLILSSNILFGTAYGGGTSGNGSVFTVSSDGTGFTNLHSFSALDVNTGTNSDGAYPYGGLVLSGNTLCGAVSRGGSSGSGTLFAVNTDGTGFTNLYSFTALSAPYSGTNSDGANPQASLILSGSTLFGTAFSGGSGGYGTVFAVNTNGTGFMTLHSFTRSSDGAIPNAGLILSGNTLYGAAEDGGSSYHGTVFSLSFAPQLTLIPSGVPPSGIILSWPTNVAGFDYSGYTLQCTANLAVPAVWSTNSTAPVVVNGQFTITNPITGDQMFYRLSQ